MGTALMESKCFLGFRLLSTNITIPGKVVGKVFALNMIPHIAHWPPPELLTDGAVVAPVLGLPHNVLAKIILTRNKP